MLLRHYWRRKQIQISQTRPVCVCMCGSCITAHCVYRQCTGRSAIFFATEDGNVKIAKILVSGGADVDLKDKVDW
jgi:hypothetical protein